MNKSLKKILSVSLCAAMLCSTAAFAEIVGFAGSSIAAITANAAEETPVSSFEYENTDDGGIKITKFVGSETEVVIPSEINGKPVTSIKWRAFSGCKDITSIIVPETVTNIDYYAFEGCTGLTSFDIPAGITKFDPMVFSCCNGITSYTVNENNPSYCSVDGVVFSKDKSVIVMCPLARSGAYTIPDTVETIGYDSFAYCRGLTSITMGDSVKKISQNAFSNCKGLTSINIGNSVETIGMSAFENCIGLTSVTFPKGITEIGSYAFSYCEGITSIDIPRSITSVKSHAFYHCSELKSVNIPDSVTSIEEYAFCSDIGLTDITIPNSITKIGTSVFRNCPSLTKMDIPESVKEIGHFAFYDCLRLTDIKITDGTRIIGANAFINCQDLTIHGKKGSYAEYYAGNYSIKFDALALSNESTITTTATVGEPVTLNAKAYFGEGSYTYALMYKKSTNTTWTKIGKKYGENSTGSFTPKSAVKYDIMINVKDSTGKVKSKTFTVDVKAPLKNKTTVNAETVKVGEKIVLKGSASGGTAGYKYAFYYKKSKNSDWLEIKESYTTKSAAFKPGSATSYDVKSVVKDADGRMTEKVFTVKVTK